MTFELSEPLVETNIQSNILKEYQFDEFQSAAAYCIDRNHHPFVSAPTGSGKTAIAQYAIEHILNKEQEGMIIYTCPIKSLCNEKYRDFNKYYKNTTIGLMTGDIIINPDSKIIIMTTEVLLNLLQNKQDFKISCAIFDEVHYINDEGRGHVWEKCIIMSLLQHDALLVLLSATIGNTKEMMKWLNNINPEKKFELIVKTQRPVPLIEYFIDNTKIRKLVKKLNEDQVINVTTDPAPEEYELLPVNNATYSQVVNYWRKAEQYKYSTSFELKTLCNQIASNSGLGIPAIIFVLSKKKCIEFAEMIEEKYTNHKEEAEILNFYDLHLKEFQTNSQYIELRKCIGRGIAYHHSGLIPKIREVVEFLIKNKLIKFVFATETFAVGLNFPVKTVVLTSLTKPTEQGFRNLLVSEYKQMAGRAGRRFIDTVGNVILWLYHDIVKSNSIPSWCDINNILNGPINPITSKYIIEPNYVLKNVKINTINTTSMKSFKYYNAIEITPFIIPDKFTKLFEIDKNIMEYAKAGMNMIDKNYNKLFNKLSKDDKVEYNNLLQKYKNHDDEMNAHGTINHYMNLENKIYSFLQAYKFIDKNDKYELTNKGELAQFFTEINSVIFLNEIELIMQDTNLIIPILSMFIDDGIKKPDQEDAIVLTDETLALFAGIVKDKYSDYINIFPKWTFYPFNFLMCKDWLNDTTMTLDHISIKHQVDMGTVVKILIKLYQITDELITKLDKINKSDLCEELSLIKNNIIRYPLTIDSLYIKI